MSVSYVIGVDEVGRGALAGPVLVCALVAKRTWADVLPPTKDSKQLSSREREYVFNRILEWRNEGILNFRTSAVGPKTIDRIGIERALRLAVDRTLRARAALHTIHEVLLDGRLQAPAIFVQRSIIKGDETVPIIALASIVAKVTRDRMISRVDRSIFGYEFSRHKGYGTSLHVHRINHLGLSPIHRKTFTKQFIFRT